MREERQCERVKSCTHYSTRRTRTSSSGLSGFWKKLHRYPSSGSSTSTPPPIDILYITLGMCIVDQSWRNAKTSEVLGIMSSGEIGAHTSLRRGVRSELFAHGVVDHSQEADRVRIQWIRFRQDAQSSALPAHHCSRMPVNFNTNQQCSIPTYAYLRRQD